MKTKSHTPLLSLAATALLAATVFGQEPNPAPGNGTATNPAPVSPAKSGTPAKKGAPMPETPNTTKTDPNAKETPDKEKPSPATTPAKEGSAAQKPATSDPSAPQK